MFGHSVLQLITSVKVLTLRITNTLFPSLNMDSNTNSLVEQRFVSGYFRYAIDDLGRVWEMPFKEGFMPYALQLRPVHYQIITNLKPEILMNLPNGIFKTHSSVVSWAQRVKLLEQSGSAKPFHSNKNKSVNGKGD